VSLLTTLPKWGPKRPKEFEPARKLWSRGAPNLVAGAQRAGVPTDELFTRLAKWWALPARTGNGMVSWVHLDDVAKATADALDRGRGGQIYNIVDDRPQSFGDFARELSAQLGRPKAEADFASAGRAGRVLPGNGVRNDMAAAVDPARP
jgi:nucleoside-diphosphate-sugar epimerase